MATASDICSYALSSILNDDATQTPATADLNLALAKLQILLDHWQLDPQATIGLSENIYTPASGTQSFLIGAVYTVTSVASASTTATVTTPISHDLIVGDKVTIAGAVQTEYNGLVTVASVPSATTFTYTFAGSATTPATGTITVSPNVVIPMPMRIEEASFARLNGVDFLIGFAASFEEYNAQVVKSNQGYPTKCFYNRDDASIWGRFYLWPASNGAELHLFVLNPVIDGFSTMALATTLRLPMGIQKPLIDCLAAELLDDYNVPNPAYQQQKIKAANSLRKWKRSNIKVNLLQMPIGIAVNRANSYTA